MRERGKRENTLRESREKAAFHAHRKQARCLNPYREEEVKFSKKEQYRPVSGIARLAVPQNWK